MKQLTQEEVLKRRVAAGFKSLKQEAKKVPETVKKYTAMYDEIPNGTVDPQSKAIDLLPPDAKQLIIGYAFIGMVEWAVEVMKNSGTPMEAEAIQKAAIERAIKNLRKDGLFEHSTPTEPIGLVQE